MLNFGTNVSVSGLARNGVYGFWQKGKRKKKLTDSIYTYIRSIYIILCIFSIYIPNIKYVYACKCITHSLEHYSSFHPIICWQVFLLYFLHIFKRFYIMRNHFFYAHILPHPLQLPSTSSVHSLSLDVSTFLLASYRSLALSLSNPLGFFFLILFERFRWRYRTPTTTAPEN